MNITYKQWNGVVVTVPMSDFEIEEYDMALEITNSNCGLCYFSGTEQFDFFPNKEEILEVILDTADSYSYSAVIFSFNADDRKDKHQVEAIEMLQQYPGASVCVAERAAGYSLFIITVPVVPVL